MANEKIEDVIKKVILGENFLAENTDTEPEQVEEEVFEEEVEDIEEAKKDEDESDEDESEDEDEEEEEEEEDKKPAFLKGKKGTMKEANGSEVKAMSMTDLKGKKYIEKPDAYSSPKLYKTADGKTANIGNAVDLDHAGAAISDEKYNRNTIKPKASAASGKIEKPSMKESIETLFAGKDLTEEFKTEAATLFEAQVVARTQEIEEELQAKYSTLLEEHTLAVTEEMVERIDEYLNYVVEEWMQENRLAVSNGLRTEITEGFIEKLRGVFAESYIEVPEEKVDLFESTVEDYETLKVELEEQVTKNMEVSDECEQLRCELLFREMAEGLTDTETQKLRNLAESIEFDSVEQFAEKLSVLRENIENIGSTTATEPSNEDSLEESYEEESETSPLMEAYIRSMSKGTED